METIFTIISGYERGIVGLLLIIIAVLLWFHFKNNNDNITGRITCIEKYKDEHDREHKQLAKDCADKHTWNGHDRRK